MPVLLYASSQAFKCSCEKIEMLISLRTALSTAQTGTAPNTRISQSIFACLKSTPSSIEATPSISTPLASIVGASITAP